MLNAIKTVYNVVMLTVVAIVALVAVSFYTTHDVVINPTLSQTVKTVSTKCFDGKTVNCQQATVFGQKILIAPK